MKKFDTGKYYVIGRVTGINNCDGDNGSYYVFYTTDGTNFKVSNCRWDSVENKLVISSTKTYPKLSLTGSTHPIVEGIMPDYMAFHVKKFTHQVGANLQNLYLVATNLYINPTPFAGWTNFVTGTPTFELATNNANTKIIMTSQLRADMETVNYNINHTCTKITAGFSDPWYIMNTGGSGRCTEFALTKAQALLDLGYPASAIHIEAGLYESSVIGHAWCVVQTDQGDFALDMNNDEVINNASFKFGTEELYARRRQIGNNWAFISPYGWLLASTQTANNVYYYILDPVLNIFHIFPYMFVGREGAECYAYGFPFGDGTAFYDGWPNSHHFECGVSVNFSEDNSRFYIRQQPTMIGVSNALWECKLGENKIEIISTTQPEVYGFVNRDGTLSVNESTSFDTVISGSQKLMSCDVISKDGYYEYKWLEAGSVHITPNPPYDPIVMTKRNWLYKHVAPSRIFEKAFPCITRWANALPPGQGGYPPIPDDEIQYTPWQIPPETTAVDYPFINFPFPLTFVDAGNVFIQGYGWIKQTNYYDGVLESKIRKSGVDIMPAILTATGATLSSLIGYVYIPCADRLNN